MTGIRKTWNPRGVASPALWVAICLLCAGTRIARADGTLQNFKWENEGPALVFKIQFTNPVDYRVYNQLKDKGYVYADFYGLTGPILPQDWNIKHAAVMHVKRLYYPIPAPGQPVMRFIFYPRAAGLTRIELNGTGASFAVTAWINGPGNSAPVPHYVAAPAGSRAASAPSVSVPPVMAATSNRKPVRAIFNKASLVTVPPAIAPPATAPPDSEELTMPPSAPQPLITPLPPTEVGRLIEIKPEPRALKSSAPKKLIIIDPGHGGKSSGAQTSSKIDGKVYYEKDIVLQIAERMVPLFDESPNLRVKLTRSKDEYVALDDRIRIADEAKGDLFVSIHLNATSERAKSARGFETYYLSDGTKETNRQLEELENDKAIAVSEGENAANLKAILSSLADDRFKELRQQSVKVGSIMDQVFQENGPFMGSSRGIKSAALRVLMNYNMPAILVECGFIDNAKDAALLSQPAAQDQIAALLFNAINLYFSRTDSKFQAHLASVE